MNLAKILTSTIALGVALLAGCTALQSNAKEETDMIVYQLPDLLDAYHRNALPEVFTVVGYAFKPLTSSEFWLISSSVGDAKLDSTPALNVSIDTNTDEGLSLSRTLNNASMPCIVLKATNPEKPEPYPPFVQLDIEAVSASLCEEVIATQEVIHKTEDTEK